MTELRPDRWIKKIELPEPWTEVQITPHPRDHVYHTRGIQGVASTLGIMGLMETLRDGGSIEIPSLRIRLVSSVIKGEVIDEK